MIRLNKDQIIELHAHLIQETGGSLGLRDEALLESALQAPFMTYEDYDLFLSIQEKAARLCYGLVMNHPFIDGNKRIGAHAMLIFLALNGIELDYSQDELSNIILQLAAGQIKSDDVFNWLIAHQQ